MKKIKEQVDIAKLLSGKVLDSLNEDEKEALSAWESDLKNRDTEEKILNAEAFEQWKTDRSRINIPNEWNKFLFRMNKENKKMFYPLKKVYFAAASVAAIFIIGVLLILYNHKNDATKDYQSIAEVNIQPGSTKAQLIIDNGEAIDLKKSVKTQINHGSLMFSNQDGQLIINDMLKGNSGKSVLNVIKTPKGGEYKLELPDGTKVWINSDTELRFKVPFTTDKREISLKGEAYFEVVHNASKPFIVTVGGESVEVLGTKFDVSAYPEDLNVVTTLAQGRVKVSHVLSNNKTETEFLLPNEQSVLNKETDQMDRQEVDASIYSAWKDGRFRFVNEPLETFLKKVSRWYNVEAYITDESLKGIRFTGDLPRYKNMKELLMILEAETSVHIDVEDNKIIYVSK